MQRYHHFMKAERLELSILLTKGYSLRAIAKALKRSHPSVSREIRKNRVHGIYDPFKADVKAHVRRKYSKYQGMKIVENAFLRRYVERRMKRRWSPANIAGRLKEDTQGTLSLKADTIYKYLYSAYGQSLCRYLHYYRYHRHRRKTTPALKKVLIPHRTGIEDRPAKVRFGDCEGDTMGRPRDASPHTLVVVRERVSRKLFACKVARLKHAIRGFEKILQCIPVHSLTLDNGVENVHHQRLRIPTFFCHPYSSWEKGSVEQGIGLLREYIPKRADLKDYSYQKITAILKRINSTPMVCLAYRTPNEVFKEQVAQLSR